MYYVGATTLVGAGGAAAKRASQRQRELGSWAAWVSAVWPGVVGVVATPAELECSAQGKLAQHEQGVLSAKLRAPAVGLAGWEPELIAATTMGSQPWLWARTGAVAGIVPARGFGQGFQVPP